MAATVNICHPHFYLDEYDLTGQHPRLDAGVSYDEIPSDGGNATSRTQVPGLAVWNAEHELFLEEGAGKTEAILEAAAGAEALCTYHPLTFADGGNAWFYKGSIFSKDQAGAMGEAYMLTARALPKDGAGFIKGNILAAKASRTTTGNGTARQLGSAAGKTVYAIIHCFTVTGTTPTLDVIVESDDNSGMTSPITRATFTQLTAAGKEYISAAIGAGVTDDWWRVSWTIGGTTPDFTFAAIVGIK